MDRFVFPDGHLVIVLPQADCGFWFCASRVPGWEGLKGMKVDIIKPQVVRFVFPVAHDVIVPAGRPTSTMSSSFKKSSTRKWRKIALISTRYGAIGDGRSPRSRRTVGRRAPRVRVEFGRSPQSESHEPKLQESCLQVRRVDCVTNAPVPQGTTASTTPPFVRAGYDCRNNTTVR